MLDHGSLLALHERVAAQRAHPTYGPLLLPRTDPGTGATFHGTLSLADHVDAGLARAGAGGLAGADDATVRTVASEVIDAAGPGELGISARPTGTGTAGGGAPALTVSMLIDGDGLAGRGSDAGFGTDVAVEEAAREVQEVLRDTATLDVWGVALDQALTGAEQGEAAGPFIGLTVLAIVLLVGVAFRSYWVMAVSAERWWRCSCGCRGWPTSSA